MNTAKINRLIAFLLLFTALFNISDYFLTMKAMKLGFEEMNPIARNLIGTGILAIVKIVIIPAVLLLIWKLRSYVGRRLLFYSSLLFSIYFLLMLYFAFILRSV